MIFSPELARKALAGQKTVTRRRIAHRDGRPLRYREGGVYALQTGRGKQHVGHVRATFVVAMALGRLLPAHAEREGFDSVAAFEARWREMHGSYDADEVVAVIGLAPAPFCGRCLR